MKKGNSSGKSNYNPFAEPENKYRNKKVEYDGKTFPSTKEANRYAELKLLERAGRISDLETQVKFVLIPTQYIDGQLIERECSYIADFVYTNSRGVRVVEDTKGLQTPEYKIKRKLMLFLKQIKIIEL